MQVATPDSFAPTATSLNVFAPMVQEPAPVVVSGPLKPGPYTTRPAFAVFVDATVATMLPSPGSGGTIVPRNWIPEQPPIVTACAAGAPVRKRPPMKIG